MSNWLALSLSVLLLATADVPGVERLRTPTNSIDSLASEDNISILPPYAAIGNAAAAKSHQRLRLRALHSAKNPSCN